MNSCGRTSATMTPRPRSDSLDLSIDTRHGKGAKGVLTAPVLYPQRSLEKSMMEMSLSLTTDAVMERVSELSLQDTAGPSLSTPQHSTGSHVALSAANLGAPMPPQASSKTDTTAGSDPVDGQGHKQRSDSFLVRNAPRIPESPDLSLPDGEEGAHTTNFLRRFLAPHFSPVSNDVTVQVRRDALAQQLSSALIDTAEASPKSPPGTDMKRPPPPMPLFGSPEQQASRSICSGSRVLKMRRVVDPVSTLFS